MWAPEIDDHLSGLKEEVQNIFRRNDVKLNRAHGLSLSHFTTQDSLTKLLKSYEGKRPPAWLAEKHFLSLWLSDVSCLNDPLEGKALFDFVEYWSRTEGSKRFSRKGFTTEEWGDLQKIASWLRADANRGDIGHADPVMRRVLVCSFTEDTDRIELWRAYGANGSGICLSMSLTEADDRLSAYPDPVSRLYHVCYSDEDKATAWTMLANHLKPLFELSGSMTSDEKELLRRRVIAECEMVFHLYKHEQYQNEHEMRLLRTFDLNDSSCFASPADAFERGVRVDLDLNRVYAYSDPFFLGGASGKIILGPKVHDASRLAITLSSFLKQLWGPEAPQVSLSTAPYR